MTSGEHIKTTYTLNRRDNWVFQDKIVVKRKILPGLYVLDGNGDEVEVLLGGTQATVFLKTATDAFCTEILGDTGWKTLYQFRRENPTADSAEFPTVNIQAHIPIIRISSHPSPGFMQVDTLRVWDAFP
ncbi:MAG: hypothetical protein Q7S76_01445 [bacterium]|nr:hypothetical protein [bacterium]